MDDDDNNNDDLLNILKAFNNNTDNNNNKKNNNSNSKIKNNQNVSGYKEQYDETDNKELNEDNLDNAYFLHMISQRGYSKDKEEILDKLNEVVEERSKGNNPNDKPKSKNNENEINLQNGNKLNIAVDERLLSNDEDDDEDDYDLNKDKDGVINFKAEIEAKGEISDYVEDKINPARKHHNTLTNGDVHQGNTAIKLNTIIQANLVSKNNTDQLKQDNHSSLLRTKQVFSKDDFEIISQLHKGAKSSILKAKYIKGETTTSSKSQIKIFKVIDMKKLNTLNQLPRVYLENEMLNRLTLPNIIKYEGSFEEKDKVFFVLEYLPKGTFADFLKINYPLIDETVRFYTGELINALEYLRESDTVLGNLNPKNIMLNENYHLKLIDFSNAKINKAIFNDTTMRFEEAKKKVFYEDNNELNQFDSPEYLSPEIINNLPSGFGTDLWALGCIIYQMYVGATPFKDKNNHLTAQKIDKNSIEYPAYIPDDAKDLISRLLVDSISKRLGSGSKGSSNDFNQLKHHQYFTKVTLLVFTRTVFLIKMNSGLSSPTSHR